MCKTLWLSQSNDLLLSPTAKASLLCQNKVSDFSKEHPIIPFDKYKDPLRQVPEKKVRKVERYVNNQFMLYFFQLVILQQKGLCN